MNLDALPFDEVINSLPPEARRDFDLARFRLALEGATDAEVTAALVTFGFLAQLLTGRRTFDRWELRQYVNLGEAQNETKRRNHAKAAGAD